MNDELKKCLSGEWYDCHAPIFIEFKKKTHRLLLKYNALPYESREERRAGESFRRQSFCVRLWL